MSGRLLRALLRRPAAVPPAVRDQSEMERVAEAARRLRLSETAPYWCRACDHPTFTPQCPLCRGKTWLRQLPDGGAA